MKGKFVSSGSYSASRFFKLFAFDKFDRELLFESNEDERELKELFVSDDDELVVLDFLLRESFGRIDSLDADLRRLCRLSAKPEPLDELFNELFNEDAKDLALLSSLLESESLE